MIRKPEDLLEWVTKYYLRGNGMVAFTLRMKNGIPGAGESVPGIFFLRLLTSVPCRDTEVAATGQRTISGFRHRSHPVVRRDGKTGSAR
jgi:hypothetical protein